MFILGFLLGMLFAGVGMTVGFALWSYYCGEDYNKRTSIEIQREWDTT